MAPGRPLNQLRPVESRSIDDSACKPSLRKPDPHKAATLSARFRIKPRKPAYRCAIGVYKSRTRPSKIRGPDSARLFHRWPEPPPAKESIGFSGRSRVGSRGCAALYFRQAIGVTSLDTVHSKNAEHLPNSRTSRPESRTSTDMQDPSTIADGSDWSHGRRGCRR